MSKHLHLKIAARPHQFLLTLGISLFFGLAWFLLLYGPHSLNFSYVDWIYVSGGDLFQHQNGWEWFRQEPWQFPLGRINAFGYPFGTYVSFTDSIPLLAMFFKLLDPLLPQNFQYLGLWELMSVTGQFIFGMLLIGEFTPSYAKKILGASLLTLSPILISRAFFHNSLTAHWILLAGIWFIVVAYRRKLWRGAWVTLFAAAILIHLYFVAMLLPLWVISLFFRYKREKNLWPLLLDILAVPVVTLLISYAIGLFSLSVGDLLAEGYGFYSWNLNGFFNSGGFSSLFGQLPTGSEGQTEGFSYLGLGNLLILPLAVFLFIKKDFSRRNLLFILPFIVISFVYVLFALSNKAFLNAYSMWDFQLPKKIEMLFALFRASGRFIWPVFYLLVLFGLISVIRNTRYATPIILVALVVQLLEVQPLYGSKRIDGSSDLSIPAAVRILAGGREQ